MRKSFFLFNLVLLVLLNSTELSARINLNVLMVKGDFKSIEKFFKKEDDLKNLFLDEAIVLIHNLILNGRIEDSKDYVDYYSKRFPKSSELLKLKRKIYLYTLNFDQDFFTENQKQHINLIKTNSKRSELSIAKILTFNNELYLPSKYDYVQKLYGPIANWEIESAALAEIKEKQKILFPKTDDFFQLAMAYKALAIVKIHENKLDQAKRFIKLAQSQVFKMRSIWLKEDIFIDKPVLKTHKRHTSFGSVYPQYLIQLREEFSSFLL